MLGIFSPLKIRRLRPGLNPRTWVPKASTLPIEYVSEHSVSPLLKSHSGPDTRDKHRTWWSILAGLIKLPDSLMFLLRNSKFNIPSNWSYTLFHDRFIQGKDKAIPVQTLRDPGEFEVPRLSDLGNGRSPPPPPSTKHFWYLFALKPESQCGRKDYIDEKLKMTPSAIEPSTFRVEAQCLNKLRHSVPRSLHIL